MMPELTYEDLSERLVTTLPELQRAYDELLSWSRDGKPGPHVVYGDVLNPYLITLLETHSDEEYEVLRRIFDFLEVLANHEDKLVRQVAAVTVLERLWGLGDRWKVAQTFMGPETRRLAKTVASNQSEGTRLDI